MPPPPPRQAAEEAVLGGNILQHYTQNFGPAPPMEFAAIPRETVRSAAAGLGGSILVLHPGVVPFIQEIMSLGP